MSKSNHSNRPLVLPPPDFTLKDLREAIPAHLFESSLPTSLYYLGKDIVQTVTFTCITVFLLSYLPSVVVLPFYWVVQGSLWFAFWILAHECGHGAFSRYPVVNNTIGMILHSLLLVPYHSWRITHANHHKSTNHIERDTAFVPVIGAKKREPPLVSVIYILGYLLTGLPAYLCFNMGGQSYPQRVSHFEPSAPIFHPRDYYDVVMSSAGILAVLSGLSYTAHAFGIGAVVVWYFIPYLIVNFWLVLITFLQHTDTRVAKYKGMEFSFLRGGLGTVDRDFGICNALFHHITDSHVVHHCFSSMPFYNAIKATPYVKDRAGMYYLSDNRPVLQCLWECYRTCKYIENGEVEVYKY